MNKKGFTLFETMVSITIFSVLMVIVFNCWTEFQKASIKNEGKQDTNIQFVNVYRNIDKLVSSSSTRLFQCYVESEIASDKRWFAFLLSRKDNQLDGKCIFETRTFTKEGVTTPITLPQRMIYNTCVVYMLNYPGCCGGFNNCPHKSIYRYVYNATSGGADGIYFGNLEACDWGAKFKNEVLNVKNILDTPNSKPHSVIENNIVDITINKMDDRVRFTLTLLRTKDASRHFQIGTRDLINANTDTKKYIENLSWISIPSNT